MDLTPVALAPAGPGLQRWDSVDDLTVSVTGRSHRLYYLLATARTADAVAHWRQSPYDIFDETVTLAVDLPQPIQALVHATGAGHLAVRVAATTLDDVPYPQEVIGRTPLTVDAGRIVGLPRERWDEVSHERPLTPGLTRPVLPEVP